jgi:hypothetical protein
VDECGASGSCRSRSDHFLNLSFESFDAHARKEVLSYQVAYAVVELRELKLIHCVESDGSGDFVFVAVWHDQQVIVASSNFERAMKLFRGLVAVLVVVNDADKSPVEPVVFTVARLFDLHRHYVTELQFAQSFLARRVHGR